MTAAALKSSVLLLIIAGIVAGVQYEIRGHIDIINSRDVQLESYDEASFTEKLKRASERMAEIVGSANFQDFFVYDYKIHGPDTAVFYAHLTLVSNPTISRQEIIDRIVATDDVQIYFLRKTEITTSRQSSSRFRVVRADVDHCLNGGILLPNATCACGPYNSGPNCEIVSCRNNGIGQNGRCSCPPGLYSAHCEARTCVTKIDSAVDFSSQSLILVINTRTSMGYDLSLIIENIAALVTDYQNQGITLSSFIVTVFRYSKSVYIMETSSFTTANDMVNYLQHVTIAPSSDDQPILDAIANSQSTQFSMRAKSTVYVFADSENLLDPTPSTLLTTTNESIVVQQTLAWRNKIILVLSQLTSSPISPTGDYFDVLRRVITAVHGDILIIDKPSNELQEVLTHLFFYTIGGQNTFVQYYSNTNKTIPILSDSKTQTTYVLLTVENGVTIPQVQDVTGNVITPTSSGKRFALFRVTQSVTDTITIMGDSLPIHSTRVWFTSKDDVLISYSEDDTVDNNYAHTFNGFNQRPSLYSSFANTTELIVSRLNSSTSSIILPASVSTAKNATTCIFQYQLAASTTCTPGPFVHNVVVAATDGNKYRAVPGYCFTPDTHSAPAWSCLNNGSRSGVSTCRCAANWNGAHCELPICLNGGTVDKFPNGGGHGNCVCPFGVEGSFCEILKCSNMSPDTFQSYNRSFAVVVQNSLSANQALARLNDGLSLMLNKGQTSDFEDYILTTYKARTINGATVADVSSTKYSSASAFLNATTNDAIAYSYSPSGPQPGLFALETTLRSMDYDKSSIFFFTDSPSSMSDQSLNFSDIVKIAVDRQIEISIVIIPPYGFADYCIDSGAFEIYELLVYHTGGNFLNFCQPYTRSGDPVLNFVASYGNSHHHTEVVSYFEVFDCSNVQTQSFYLSGGTNDAYAVVYSPNIESFSAQLVDVNTKAVETLDPDSQAVPFFASFPLTISAGSSLQYTLNLTASSRGQCFVRITERSQFAVYLGFSPDPSFDRFSYDLTYATHLQPVIHLSSTLQSEPTIDVTAYGDQNNIAFTSSFTKRTSGCKYEYIMDNPYTCQSGGATFTMAITMKTNEVTIMRSPRAYCNDLNGCINGGIMLGGQCQCLSGYTGIYCEFPVCQNGGTLDNFKCQCDGNHDGDICQYTSCNAWNFLDTHDPREYNFQQIVFVVEVNTRNMVIPTSILQNNIQAFVDGTDGVNHPKQYTLITFDDNNIRVVVSTTQTSVFVAAFLNEIPFSVNTPTQVKGLEAISTAYNTLLDLPGIVYVFAGTSPRSYSNAVNQRFGVQVNIIWMGADLTPTNINPYYTAIARQSNGRILPVTPIFTQQILDFLPYTIKENQLIFDDGAKDCTAGVNFQFPVENLATTLTLVATGTSVSLTVTDEKSNTVDLTNSSTFTDVNTVIRTINIVASTGGTWNVQVKSAQSCYLQARVNSPLQIIPRFTNDQGDDFGSGVPRVGAGTTPASYITFRVMDSYNSDSINFGSTVAYVESSDTDPETPWTVNSNFKNTSVILRDPVECASQFVTPLINWTSTYMKFVVRGKDSNYSNFQRIFFFSMNGKASDCQNGATVDILGFCQCDSNHFGSVCQQRNCQNGGISAYGLCDCPNGYYGDYCEQYLSPSPGVGF